MKKIGHVSRPPIGGIFPLFLLWIVVGRIIGTASAQGQSAQDTSLLKAEDILLDLFESTGGLRWTQHGEWLLNDNYCAFYGVSCYPPDYVDQRRQGHVQKIDLSSNNLVGTVPSDVFSLPYIESLIFRDNSDLDVNFQSIGDAQFLKELVISDTGVKSLDGIQGATALEILHVTNLNLGGSFPSGVLQLSNLRGFYANHNSFSGPLSSLIGNLVYLEELFLLENDLDGRLPSTLGNLRNLKTLSLGQNAFSGELPVELEQCTSLEILAIHRVEGSEKGPGISGDLPSLSKLENVAEVYFQNQRLSGSIPTDFLANAPYDQPLMVDLTGNSISGNIPQSLAEKRQLSLFLGGNNISPLTAEFCTSIPNWMGGAVATLGCDALLCPAGTYSPEGRATETAACQSCPSSQKTGSMSCSPLEGVPVDENAILVSFYSAMGGQYWQSSTNWLDESKSVCSWEGVDCTDEGLVSAIGLSNHGLTNAPPDELFYLPELQRLDLSFNSLKGFKFSAVGAASKLEILDLTQSDIQSLEGVGSMATTSIKKLALASNYIVGEVPEALWGLTSLESLDISHNQITGTLSSSIGNLGELNEFLAADNSFSSTLPTQFETLTKLEMLSLHQATSSSSISGTLPAFSNLRELTSLQLYGNALTGNLPANLLMNTIKGNSEIEVLLSDNSLIGTVPSSWARFSQLFVDLTGNKLTGISSELCSKGSWMEGAVGSYGCDSILCPSGTYNELGRKTSAEGECSICPGSQFLGAKNCNGQPNEGEIDILRDFFTSTNGQSWVINDGWTSSADVCSWHGLECNSAGQVLKIDLSKNGLSGTPSSSVFKLQSLTELNLLGNQISFSFDGISEAKQLTILNLAETNLDTVAGIGAATSLTELHLTDNDLQGSDVFTELFLLTNLRVLYLNFNQLEGSIPSEIASLQNLEALYMFNNRLSGELPASIGSMQKLRILALSENNFSGV